MEENKHLGVFERKSYQGGTEVGVFHKFAHDPRAGMAEKFVTEWGQVAGIPDGEDSAGRSKLRLATVEEMTTRACDAADALYTEFEQRGWLVALPSPKAPTEEP